MSEPLRKFLFSLTIVLPAIIGAVRYRNADTAYRPFFYYIFYSLFNELFVFFYIDPHCSKDASIINWQVFNLAECMLLLTQFYYWHRFKTYRAFFLVLLVIALAGWLSENFIFSTIYTFHPVFLIAYSFIIVLLSINTINHQVVNYNRTISKNALFIICVAFVIFFIYTIVVFTILATNKKHTAAFSNVFEIQVYINALANILYAVGIYHIPGKTLHRNIFQKK